MTSIPQELHIHWTAISPLLSIRNEHEYDLAVELLNRLLDEVGADEQHPLYTLTVWHSTPNQAPDCVKTPCFGRL